MVKFRIGRHISTGYGFQTVPSYAKRIGCNIFQIFLGFPQQIISKAKPEQVLIKFGEELYKNKIKMVVHGSYTINLCHPESHKLFKTSIKSLVQDLNSSAIIGKRCIGTIIHVGKNITANNLSYREAVGNFIFGIKEALKKSSTDSIIIIETGASQGTEIATTIIGLREIYDGLNTEEKKRIKFCVDTCHIFSSNYDISTPTGVKNFFQEFEKYIGVNKIACIHFNDSKTPLGSRIDRHADLGYGFIKASGLKSIAKYAKKMKIPLICETPLDAIDPKKNREISVEDEFALINSWLKD